MRRQFRMPLNDRNRTRPPAFVGWREGCGAADGKGGNHVQTEGGSMVVVDQEDDIRLVVFHPLFGEIIALEYGLPVGFLRLARVDGYTNGGHVRGIDGGGDFGHVQALAFWLVL